MRTMGSRFSWPLFGPRPVPQFEAAVLPASGDVVISCDAALADERISASKARAIYNAVKRHDSIVAAEAAVDADQAGRLPSVGKTGEQTGEHFSDLPQIDPVSP